MFYIKEPLTKNSSWVLSFYKDEKVVSIPKYTVSELRNYHILGVDFLYQSYKKQFKGVILNEEDGMNMQLQVAAFLNSMTNSVEHKFLVLIIAPDRNILNWHYHLTVHGGLKVQIITPKTCPEDFDQEHGLALLLPFSNLKLSEYLIDYDYFSVVIDSFDEVALKLVIRKLRGSFNIGLTQRNFYTDPDQKLQWTMLNWCNPGCVGKLADFYEIDNDNFANFRNNYRHWWFRLTWNFCETFKKITEEEKREYVRTLSKWAASHHLSSGSVKQEKTAKKRSRVEIIDDKPTGSDQNKLVKKAVESFQEPHENETGGLDGQEPVEQSKHSTETNSQSSADTIIYEVTDMEKERDANYVKLPSMDENPILNSIIRNFETSPDPIPSHPTSAYSPTNFGIQAANCSKAFEEEDEENVLLSIMDDKIPTNPALDEETELMYEKEELRSQIFSDEPCSSKNFYEEDHSDFFQSLIDSDIPTTGKNDEALVNISKYDDINSILKETEVLLK